MSSLRLLLVVLLPGLAVPAQDRTLRVFVLAGQSNMEGADAHAAEIDALPRYRGLGAPQERIRYWYLHGPPRPENGSGRWIPLQPDQRRGIFGPELTFGRTVAEHSRAPIAIIKSAWGGTTLARDWDPDAPSEKRLYARTLALVREALDALRRQRVPFRLEAVLWHQGENDMLDQGLLKDYGKRLAAFIARWRRDLEAPELPWFVGEISDQGIWGLDHRDAMRSLRAQQRAVCDADPHAWWVPTSHLAFKVTPDGHPHYHFGTEGQLQHGEAYARAWLASCGRAPEDGPPAFTGPALPRGRRVRVFLLAGQRSAEGDGAHVTALKSAKARRLSRPRRSVRFRYRLGGGAFSGEDWTALAPVDPRGLFGPELSLGAALDEALPDPVALLKATHGGAMLADWLPEPRDANQPQYADVLTFVRKALADLRGAGARPSLEALFWIPGEHDAWWPPFRRRYREDFPRLVAALRRDLEAPRLRVVVPTLPPQLRWGRDRLEELNATLREIATADPRITVLEPGDLPIEDGAITLGAAGCRALGQRLAAHWLRLHRAR